MSSQPKKDKQLGMNFATACGRLRKQTLFSLVKRLDMDLCFRCGDRIASEQEFSIDHKVAWQDRDPGLFWDQDNIAFAHLACNAAAARKTRVYGDEKERSRAGFARYYAKNKDAVLKRKRDRKGKAAQ